MKLKIVDSITDIKKGDTLIITGHVFKLQPFKVQIVKVSEEDGTEIIVDKKKNIYFNLGMYLNGNSWAKEVCIIEN